MKVVINEGTSFLIANEFGDSFGKESGLYYQDTRFLNKFKIFIDGRNPVILGSKNVDHYSAVHYLTNLHNDQFARNSFTIKRSHFVGRGLHEDIDITNHLNETVEFKLAIELDADFADIFEVKQLKVRKRKVDYEIDQEKSSLIYSYNTESFLRKTVVKFSKCKYKPTLRSHVAIFNVKIEPKKSWHTCLDISTSLTKRVQKPLYTCHSYGIGKPEVDSGVEEYLNQAPYLETNVHLFERAFGRAKQDLGALALRVSTKNGSALVTAAGIPWFVTLFGRDSIIAGMQSLILTPIFAKGTLEALASRQGKAVNDFNKEQPGAIVHEVRFGELAVTREVPHALFYATIDATPLFLLLISEYFKWTGDLELVRKLTPNIEAALGWIDNYGDMDGDGYLEYPKESISWKDSFDSMVFNNGKIAESPTAVSEPQAYVYAAKMAIAEIYKLLNKEGKALELKKQAADLKKRFNQDFWMEDKGYYALALDKDKKQVDSIASNAGHLLWCGIVPKDRAKLVAEKLVGRDMFSGWGIRTLSQESAAFNPISYHRGSIWPHDNAIIAAGLRKYGFDKEAVKVIESIIKASKHFEQNRLPELFCGYEKNGFSFPVDYPTSSSPQAWASSTIPFFLSTLLGIEPMAHQGKVTLKPIMLSDMNYLGIHGIKIGNAKINIHLKEQNGKIKTDIQTLSGKLDYTIG